VRTSFVASAVAFERADDLNAQCLVLAEHPDGSGRRLEVQRSLRVDEQDRSLGMDTYCLVTEEQDTHYGGVLDWRIEGSTLHVDLTEEADRVMGASESESRCRSQSAPRSSAPHSCCSRSAAPRQKRKWAGVRDGYRFSRKAALTSAADSALTSRPMRACAGCER